MTPLDHVLAGSIGNTLAISGVSQYTGPNVVGISISLVQALLVQRLVTRLGEIAVAFGCLLLQMVGSLAMCYNPIFVLIYPIAILRSAASGFIFPTLGSLSAKRVSHSEQGVLMGVTTALNGLMGIFSPILAGLMYDHWSPGAPYWLAAIFFVASAFLLRTQRPAASGDKSLQLTADSS